MSIESVLARVAELRVALEPPAAAAPPPAAAATSSATPVATAAGASPFAGALQQAMAASATPTVGAAPGGDARARLLAAAQGEVGQAEMPPGSNDSPRIAMYRSATAGAPGPGPWCAYFVSWAARQAGVPLGDAGQGFGSVDQLAAWAQGAGRALPPTAAAQGQVQPGDLILFPEHVGIVESVNPDGSIQTVEGNHSDRVDRVTRRPGEWTGFVRTG